jgi:ectoine hydroxylase-related dioxygenase (phytanoyl-CoA dioxygenase family)
MAEETARRNKTDPTLLRHLTEMLEQGYTVVRDTVSSVMIDRAIDAHETWAALHKIEAERWRGPDGFRGRVTNLHLIVPEIATLFSRNPKALAVQDFFFNRRTSVYTSLFFERGTEQPIHQDVPLFYTLPDHHYFGMWVALEDADEENGALAVIEGGHKVELPNVEAIGLGKYARLEDIPPTDKDLWNAYQEGIVERCMAKGLKVKSVPVKRGDTLIWHPLLPHGGSKRGDTSRSRRSIVFHTVPEGAPVFQQDYFFNPRRGRDPKPRWTYRSFEGRLFACHGPPSFGNY